jgi:hypothetical protein
MLYQKNPVGDKSFQVGYKGFDYVDLPGRPSPETTIPVLLVLANNRRKPAALFNPAAQALRNNRNRKPDSL